MCRGWIPAMFNDACASDEGKNRTYISHNQWQFKLRKKFLKVPVQSFEFAQILA